MENLMPQEVLELFDLYNENNFKLYLVGGSLRDLLSERQIMDYDFTTDALPSETKSILKEAKIIDIGKEFGTLKIFYKGFEFEITPFRKESEYDHRKPGKVSFGIRLKEDLERRDFTINALAWSPRENMVDYFNGKEDLDRKIIRAIGDPKKRFKEDVLRLLRGVRFAAKEGFSFEKNTFLAIKEMSGDLKYISRERILEEFTKIITGENPAKGIRLLEETDILKFLFPRSSKLKRYTFNHPEDLSLQLTLLLEALYKDVQLQKEHLYRYPYPKELRRQVLFLLEHKRDVLLDQPYFIRKNRAEFGNENMERLIRFKENTGENLSLYKKSLQDVLKEKPCLSIKNLAVSGKDLINIGIPPGPLIGKSLEFLFDEVLKDPSKNKKEILLRLVTTPPYNQRFFE